MDRSSFMDSGSNGGPRTGWQGEVMGPTTEEVPVRESCHCRTRYTRCGENRGGQPHKGNSLQPTLVLSRTRSDPRVDSGGHRKGKYDGRPFSWSSTVGSVRTPGAKTPTPVLDPEHRSTQNETLPLDTDSGRHTAHTTPRPAVSDTISQTRRRRRRRAPSPRNRPTPSQWKDSQEKPETS